MRKKQQKYRMQIGLPAPHIILPTKSQHLSLLYFLLRESHSSGSFLPNSHLFTEGSPPHDSQSLLGKSITPTYLSLNHPQGIEGPLIPSSLQNPLLMKTAQPWVSSRQACFALVLSHLALIQQHTGTLQKRSESVRMPFLPVSQN